MTIETEAGWATFPWLGAAFGELMDRVARYGTVIGAHNVHAHDSDGHIMSNPRIVEYFTATSKVSKDENTAWCSAFANWCMLQAGVSGTRSAMARSWLTWKGGVKLDDSSPVPGAVAVFSRGNSPDFGHVAFVWHVHGDGSIDVLGGNQGGHAANAKHHVAATSSHVSIAHRKKGEALGYLWPKSYAQPDKSAISFLTYKEISVPADLRPHAGANKRPPLQDANAARTDHMVA